MSTNFYWIKNVQKDKEGFIDSFMSNSPECHIGKRSAAGQYCLRCNKTLCKEGEDKVHYVESHWYDKCPKCKKTDEVKTVCSFSWTAKQHKTDLQKLVSDGNNEKVVVDEYGEEYSAKEFLAELQRNVKINFLNGIRFS